MPKRAKTGRSGKIRVARHRRSIAAAGVRRLEVSIPAEDAALLRKVAATLRSGGKPARATRKALQSVVASTMPGSGKEIVEFFRSSPLVGVDLVIERDRSPGRPIDL